jgi:hypothetical protein
MEFSIDLDPIASLSGIFDPDSFSFDMPWEVVFLSFVNNDFLIDVGW